MATSTLTFASRSGPHRLPPIFPHPRIISRRRPPTPPAPPSRGRRPSARQMVWQSRLKERKLNEVELEMLTCLSAHEKMPDVALQHLPRIESEGVLHDCANLTDLMLLYADNGLFPQAQALWGEIIHSSLVPRNEVVSDLIEAYARMGQFDEIIRVLHESASRGAHICPEIYSQAAFCFGRAGQLKLMETTIKEMVSRGFKVDSKTGNAYVIYYSMHASLTEMETAYERLKKSRILIEEEAIRAMASAYISERKLYRLGEFMRDIGLGRRNVGNLLWNILLLSYAANFKMKSLQREFLNMVNAGFSPDLTTFNVRALAFSRMCMFWDLHLSIEHMQHESLIPDLVTYGCIVDAYMDRRLGRNLYFALDNLNSGRSPLMLTDPIVFEAFGKGDFQTSSETLMESTRQRDWTYSKLVSIYLRKQYRSDQVFWNY